MPTESSRWTTARREALVFLIAFLASYAIMHEIVVEARLDTDFRGHLRMVRQFFTPGMRIEGHFLFHFLAATISRITGAVVEQSALVLVAGSIGASAVIVHARFLGSLESSRNESRADEWMKAVLTVAALTMTAVFYPTFNEIYVGQSSPTVWHNPTSMLLKPFALLGAICLERILFEGAPARARGVVLATVLVGMLAKPAFAIVLIPVSGGLALYMSLPPRWRFVRADHLPVETATRNFLLVLTAVAAALLLSQSFYIFLSERSTTGFTLRPFAVWSRHTTNIPLSILLGIAFPLGVTLLELRRGVSLRGLALAWALVIVGAAVYALFAERGRVLTYGNFAWGYQIALSVLFAFAVRAYLWQWRHARRSWIFLAVTAVLAGHMYSGFYYLYQILVLNRYH